MLVGLGVDIEQTFDALSANDVRLDNLLGILGCDLRIERVVGNHLDDGAFLAEAEATSGHHVNLVGDFVLVDDPLQVLHNLVAVRGLATRTAAAQQLQVRCSASQTATLVGGV